RMVDRNAAFRQHFLKVAIADRIATIPAHRPQDHITLEMAPLEIRHRSVRPISAKHAQASRFLQQSRQYEMQEVQAGDRVTVRGKHRQVETVNDSSGSSAVQHRMVAYTAFIHRQPEDDMRPEQFVEHVAALEDAARIEDEAEREMATTAADAGAERSLQDTL